MWRLSYFVWLLVLVTFTLSPLTTSRKLNDKSLNGETSDDHSEAGLTEETAKADDEANAGVFGFTFSPFTFLFGSDTDDEDKRGEKEGTDDASEENAEEETEKEALEEAKEKEAVMEDTEVTDANEKESSVYSEDKKEIEDEDEQVLDTHADALDESDIADNDKNEIQKSVNPAEAEDGTTEMEENELGSDHNSEVRGRENADKAIDAANTDVTDQRKSSSQENTDKYDLNTLHKTIEESTRGEASEVFIENEDDSFLETEPQSETVPADSGSQKPSEATEKTTKYADTKEKKARKSNSDAGRNYTNFILVNSLKPMKPHSRRHHEKHHHRHLTNDVLPEVSGPASGREGHFKSEKTKVDNSSLMQADPRFCQPTMPMMDDLDRYMKTCENCLVHAAWHAQGMVGQKCSESGIDGSKKNLQEVTIGGINGLPCGKLYEVEREQAPSPILNKPLNSTVDGEEQEDKTSANSWPPNAVKLLVEEWVDHKPLFASSTMKKVEVWRKISRRLHEKGHSFGADACDKKWRSMKHRHKTIKDSNKATGMGRTNWPYFNLMEDALEGDPAVHPVVHLSAFDEDGMEEASEQRVRSDSTSSSGSGARSSESDCPVTPSSSRALLTNDHATTPSTDRACKRRRTEQPSEWLLEWKAETLKTMKELLEIAKEKRDLERERNDLLRQFLNK